MFLFLRVKRLKYLIPFSYFRWYTDKGNWRDIEIVKFRFETIGKKKGIVFMANAILTVRGSFRAIVGGPARGGEGPLVFNVNSQIGEGQGNQLTANE